MSKKEHEERLLIHRDLEFLRAAGKAGKRRQPPAKRAAARKRVTERATKLTEAERIARKKKT